MKQVPVPVVRKLVKEFGEGVDRMFREMAEAGLPAPEYMQNEFMVYATIRQAKDVVTTGKTTEKVDGFNLNDKEPARSWQGVGKELGVDFNILKDIADFCVEAHSLSEIAEHLGLSDRYKMKKKYMDPLLGKCFDMTIPNSPNNPGQKYYLTELGKALLENEK